MKKTNVIPEGITTKEIKIARTKTGIPCLWESSTDFEDLRRATVVYNSDGTHKNAVFLKKDSKKQALVPISVGDLVTKVFEDKNGYAISVFVIHEISPMKNDAIIYPVFRRSSLDKEDTWKGTSYEKMVSETIEKLVTKETVIYAQFEKTYE
jgi:hypothetical protein